MQNILSSFQHVYNAEHIFSENDINPSQGVPDNLIPDDDRDAGGIPASILMSVGTRVMLIRNLNTQAGLVNGVIGTVFTLPGETDDNPCINVKFEHITQPGLLDTNGCVDIPLYEQEFMYQGRYIIRRNFPIIPSWALTVHKVQGLSLESAAISIGPSVFTKGQAYVALSRVKSLSSFYLLSLCQQKILADPNVINEYLQLSMLD